MDTILRILNASQDDFHAILMCQLIRFIMIKRSESLAAYSVGAWLGLGIVMRCVI